MASLLATLLALAGLTLITTATAALAGAWWAVLVAGVFLVAVAYGLHQAGQANQSMANHMIPPAGET